MVRYKNRYILCEIIYTDNQRVERHVTDYMVYGAVINALQTAHGDFGIGSLQSSLCVKYVNPITSMVLIRARRGAHKMVQSALYFIKKIGQYEAFFRTLHLGGTIRSCCKFLIKHHKQMLPRLLSECKNKEEIRKVQEIISSYSDEYKKEQLIASF
ncbi:hypothetical protein ACJMK2_037190 [Sinanodonta woodiana]|uniref:Ribonuclease P/MRP protein subunit POP5 n=1 Tax=Sinanodonta woodiana TaxID=1069815 RepID=A0ABD3WN33_SINWO